MDKISKMNSTIDINRPILNRFVKIYQKNRLAHAYLLAGPKGIGKVKTALSLAKLLNCVNNPVDTNSFFCDQCPACLKINSGNHPDVHFLEAQDGSIKIEQIRGLIDRINLKPFEARIKIFILKDIENLTLEAANCLLKTLEEPSRGSLLLLTTRFLEKNLSTIRSRCQLVWLALTPKDQLARALESGYHVDQIQSHFFAHFSQGSLGRALTLNEEKFFDKKNEFIDQFIITRFGVPSALMFDNASYVLGNVITEIALKRGFKLKYSANYYPQGNGFVESTNKNLIRIIKRIVDQSQKN